MFFRNSIRSGRGADRTFGSPAFGRKTVRGIHGFRWPENFGKAAGRNENVPLVPDNVVYTWSGGSGRRIKNTPGTLADWGGDRE